ncbi:MAG TPA: tripartite tricarboxylate transporter substrate binding protein [Burkholderiales bacterium]|nr:tripartite tricarboxylate transporter substrate binding protein [Burkholderiales bacterium]
MALTDLSKTLIALILAAPLGAVFAQGSYPNRPLRIVAAEPGGGGDLIARLIAHELAASLGQQVIVENRGGASGMIAANTVAKASADGHTLLFYSGFVWTLPLMKSVPYDPVKDFIPITLTARAPNILVVNPALAAKSVKDLIALAKAKPNELSYASSGSGGTPHLAAELFKSMAGVTLVHVPYKGQAQALSDLIGGQIQVMFPNAASVAPHIKAGRVRALAVTTPEPSVLAPGLPTVASAGLPGYESVVMFGAFVPAKTPGAIVERLHREIVNAVRNPDVKEKLFNTGAEAVGTTSSEFAALIKSDMARLGKVIREAGIRAD